MNPVGQTEYKPIGGIEREFLFRNINDGETMVYRKIAGDAYSYTELTDHPVWELASETKEIMGYICQLATCNYRGRIWKVWFSPDIPINEGPWKLFGLPGLVLDFAISLNTLHGNSTQYVPSDAQYDFQERDYPHVSK